MTIGEAALVLNDGTVFEGEAIGAQPPTRRDHRRGRLQHRDERLPGDHHRPVLRRPDHHLHLPPHRQLRRDRCRTTKRAHPACRGVIVRDLARRPSSWRAEKSLDQYLKNSGLSGIAGIDTRRLTRHLRDAGAVPGAFGTADEATLLAAAKAEPGTDNQDLATLVTCKEPYLIGSGPKHIVAYDFGIKRTILRHLTETRP